MTTQAEDQARQLMAEAEKKLVPKNFFFSIFTNNRSRMEDAISCYQRAGNLFKLSKNWLEASSAFKLSGDLNVETKNSIEAANDYVKASKCLEKFDTHGAINCLLSAIQIYSDMGRFIMTGKLHCNIAEIYEHNLELEEAVQHYEQAADYFKAEESYVSAKKCLLKVAEYASAEFKDFFRAITIYEEVAMYDLKTPLLQYNVKDNLFKAVLCHLCVDVLNGRHALNLYLQNYPNFDVSREFMFLEKLIASIEESQKDDFNACVRDYDSISRLDTWHWKMLTTIKNQIDDQPDLL